MTINVSEEECNKTHILGEAIKTVYERPDTHGEPEKSFKTIASLWTSYIGASREEGEKIIAADDVANMMILLKVARNAEGHYHEDNWIDIAGYSENGARVEKQ